MSVGVEALFTSALGLQPPWVVEDVKLDVPAKRIDFEVSCSGALLSCPACGAASQPVHDRLRRSWRGRHRYALPGHRLDRVLLSVLLPT